MTYNTLSIVWNLADLFGHLESLEAACLVIEDRHRRIERAGMQPDPFARQAPGDPYHLREAGTAEPFPDVLGIEAEVDDLGAPLDIGRELRVSDPRASQVQ